MNQRNFKDWLSSYFSYARDGFCPDSFHLWTGLSIMAAALERKVWIEQPAGDSMIFHFPNIYVMLVSHPQVGKSTALNRGTEFLDELKDTVSTEFKIIPNQATEPALVELMNINRAMQIGSLTIRYSSGFFCASEASASALQNTCGDFIATVTELYDCPRVFRKGLKGNTTVIPNVCFNMLVGSTFNYLKTLINEESALGGFASRCIYVIAKDRKVREAKWRASAKSGSREVYKKLFADLALIHKLQGKFQPTQGFIDRWEAWQPEFDKWLISLNSPRLEGINARKGAHLMKTAMLLSVSERDDLIVDETHWDRARELIDEVTKDNAHVLSSALMANPDTQAGMTQLITQSLKSAGGELSSTALRSVILKSGGDLQRYDLTMNFLLEAHHIRTKSSGRGVDVELLRDPDGNL